MRREAPVFVLCLLWLRGFVIWPVAKLTLKVHDWRGSSVSMLYPFLSLDQVRRIIQIHKCWASQCWFNRLELEFTGLHLRWKQANLHYCSTAAEPCYNTKADELFSRVIQKTKACYVTCWWCLLVDIVQLSKSQLKAWNRFNRILVNLVFKSKFANVTALSRKQEHVLMKAPEGNLN